ncbi:hypothetical protein J2S66_002496 [Saccharothrix longispora]|uniref:Uncharacterized protein n=1 Tax=Saccharothrix longispora TaxID=33920 RepID=A0ABU1PTY7_9PSEU|nr:hypothetical protein [Saccharothrix longispora]
MSGSGHHPPATARVRVRRRPAGVEVTALRFPHRGFDPDASGERGRLPYRTGLPTQGNPACRPSPVPARPRAGTGLFRNRSTPKET